MSALRNASPNPRFRPDLFQKVKKLKLITLFIRPKSEGKKCDLKNIAHKAHLYNLHAHANKNELLMILDLRTKKLILMPVY